MWYSLLYVLSTLLLIRTKKILVREIFDQLKTKLPIISWCSKILVSNPVFIFLEMQMCYICPNLPSGIKTKHIIKFGTHILIKMSKIRNVSWIPMIPLSHWGISVLYFWRKHLFSVLIPLSFVDGEMLPLQLISVMVWKTDFTGSNEYNIYAFVSTIYYFF